MKRICYLILLAIMAYSCSTYQATVKKQEPLSYDAVRVHPGWQYQNPKAKKVILPLIGGVIGGIYGYQNETIYGTDTLAEIENASIWASGGAVAGGILNGLFFPRRKGRYDFEMSQSDKWIRKYNKASGNNYLIAKTETGNTLVLVPRANVLAFQQKYQRLERDLESANPVTDFQTLQAWEARLEGEYSVLPDEEVRYVAALIESHKENIATKTLLERAKRLDSLSDSYPSLAKADAFLAENRTLFQHASPQGKTDIRQIVEVKINYLLDILVAQKMRDHAGLGFPALNALSSSFDSEYGDFADYRQVQEAKDRIRMAKEQKLLAKISQVKTEVKSAAHVKDVVALERLYLSLLQPSENPRIADLARQMAQRKAEIKKEKRLLRERKIRARQLAEARALARHGLRFRTDGLSNTKLIKDFFYGNFVDIPYHRDDLTFVALLKQYMYTAAKRCPPASRYDHVQITESECKTERVVRNGYGVEIDRYCIEWMDVGTGLYTSPALYRAYQTVANMVQRDALANTWNMMKSILTGGMGAVNASLAKSASLQSDIERLFQMNGCNNRAMQRFEANLIQFATNNPPITLAGRLERQTVDYDEEQDWEKLVKDLVYADSKRWTFQYVRNSVRNVRVVATDEYNRPQKITASYQFNGFSNGQTGQVTITFRAGLPDCIYYLNFSSNCETPDRSIVADLVKGKYSAQ
mgnify:CR=1 FL=1